MKPVDSKRDPFSRQLSAAATSVGEPFSRQTSEESTLTSMPAWSPLLDRDLNEPGVPPMSLEKMILEEPLQEEFNLEGLDDILAEGAAEGCAFMDLDDIFADGKSPAVLSLDEDTATGSIQELNALKRSVGSKRIEYLAKLMEKRNQLGARQQARSEENRQRVLEMMDDLNAAFGEYNFQRKLQDALAAERQLPSSADDGALGFVSGRQSLVLGVHRKILRRYGYGAAGTQLGVYSMLLSLEPYCQESEMLEKLAKTDELLGLPEDATLYDIFDAVDQFLPVISMPSTFA